MKANITEYRLRLVIEINFFCEMQNITQDGQGKGETLLHFRYSTSFCLRRVFLTVRSVQILPSCSPSDGGTLDQIGRHQCTTISIRARIGAAQPWNIIHMHICHDTYMTTVVFISLFFKVCLYRLDSLLFPCQLQSSRWISLSFYNDYDFKSKTFTHQICLKNYTFPKTTN